MSKSPQQQSLQLPEHEKNVAHETSVVHVNVKTNDIFQFILQNDLDRKITDTSLFNDSTNRQPFNDNLIRCYALRPQENCFGIRVNTILSYCAINQKVPNLFHLQHMARLFYAIEFSISFFRFLICGIKYFHRHHHH